MAAGSSKRRTSAKADTSQTTANGRRGGRPSQREGLLAAAVELFARGGTRGTTLEAIAREIGVTRPAITHHFGTKEALLREVVAVTDSLDVSALATEPYENGLEAVSDLRAWARVLVQNPQLANLSKLSVVMTVEAFEADYPAHEQFVARHGRFREEVRRHIRLGQRDGSIRPDIDAQALAAEIISFQQGAGVQWFLDPHQFDIVSVYDHYFDRLVDDIATGAKSRGGAVGGDRRRSGAGS